MTNLYLKYSGTTVDEATDISYTNTIGSVGSFSFNAKCYMSETLATWVARKGNDVYIYESGSDTLLFVGMIEYVTPTKSGVNCQGSGYLAHFKKTDVPADLTNFLIDTGRVATTPTTEAVTDTDDFADAPPATFTLEKTGANSIGRAEGGYFHIYAEYEAALKYSKIYYTVTDPDVLDNTYIQFKIWLNDFANGGTTEQVYITLFDDAWSPIVMLVFGYTNPNIWIKYTVDGGANYTLVQNVAIWTWYTIKILCKPSEDHISIYVDTVLKNENVDKVFGAVKYVCWYVEGNAATGHAGLYIDDFVASIQHYQHYIDVQHEDTGVYATDNPGLTTTTTAQLESTKRFLVISDSTDGSTQALVPTTASAPYAPVEFATLAGTFASCAVHDGTYWKLSLANNKIGTLYLPFTVEDYNISDGSSVTSIQGYIAGQEYSTYNNLFIDVYWSKDGTTKTLKIGTIYFHYGNPVFPNPFEFKVDLKVDTTSDFLGSSGGELTGGGIIIENPSFASTAGGIALWIDAVNLTLNYKTSTFDTVSAKISTITHNLTPTLYDTLRCYDSTPTADLFAFGGKGIAEGDTWELCHGGDYAFGICFTGINVPSLTVSINEGVAIDKACTVSLTAPRTWELWTTLCEYYNYIWFFRITSGVLYLYALEEGDVDAATVTYSTSVDPPSVATLQFYDNVWGGAKVVFKNGVTPDMYAASPPAGITTIFREERDDILTMTVAKERATKLAEYYSTEQISIGLEWDYYPTNFPVVGTKYNFTGIKWNGSAVVTDSYTDQICRRVTVSQDATTGGKWKVQAWFGRAASPPEEEQGHLVAESLNRGYKNKMALFNARNVGVSAHYQLSAIQGNGAVHGSAAEMAWVTAQSAVTAYRYVPLDASDKANIDWSGFTATTNDTVILDLVNGDSESKSAGITETNNIVVIPSTAVAVKVRVIVTTTTANTACYVDVFRNGNTNTATNMRVYAQSTANYYNGHSDDIMLASGKIKVKFSVAGTVTAYISIKGYWV